MTNEELQQKVKRLEEEIINLKLKLEEKKPYEVEVPENIENYYYVDEGGDIKRAFIFNETWVKKVYQNGLIFKTEEEAEKYDKERILLFKMHKWEEEHNGGWTPNWNDCNETKYFIIFDKLYKTFKIDCYARIKPFSKLPYFKSEELAKRFIEEFGDEIKEVLC